MLALLATFAISAPAQESLGDYLSLAAERNAGLKASFNSYMAALEAVPQAGALPDPQLAFGYFVMPVETRMGPQQARIAATQMFPWLGTLDARKNAAAMEARGKYEAFEEMKSKLFYEVRTTWYNLWFNQKAIAVTRENIKILESLSSVARVRVESGLSPASDLYRLEMEIGDLKNNLARLIDNKDLLTVSFINLLNAGDTLEVNIPLDLVDEATLPDREILLDSLKKGNHSLKVLSLQQEALTFRREVAENMGKPELSIGFDYIITSPGPLGMEGKDAFMPRVGISVPIYRNRYRAMVNEVNYLHESKAYESEERVNILETLFEKGWKEYVDAGRRLELYERQVELAGLTLKLLEASWMSGTSGFDDIIRMERRSLEYQLQYEKAKIERLASRSFFNYLTGN